MFHIFYALFYKGFIFIVLCAQYLQCQWFQLYDKFMKHSILVAVSF